jgi:cobalt-zinc-cadmium resistance protein CzcA
VTLTASIAALGLVPFLFASGPGSEIQKPLAIVVIGGLVTATLLTLFLLPILYDHFALPRAERIKVDEFIREKEAVEAAEAAAVAARTVPAQAAE